MTDIVVNGRTYTDGPSLPDGSKLGMTPSAVDEGFRSNFLQHFIPDHLTVAGAATGAAATATTKAAEAEASAEAAAISEAAASVSSTSANAAAVLAGTIAVSVEAIQFAVATGTGDALVAAFTPPIAAYVDGLELRIRTPGANSVGNPTINADGLGARVLVKQGGAALSPGDYAANMELALRYRSATGGFEVLNPKASSPVAGSGIAVAGSMVSFNPATHATAGLFRRLTKFTGSGPYAKPAWLKFAVVELVGGGGGGASSVASSSNQNEGGGGGGGGYALKIIQASAMAVSETVTVGAGGAGGNVSDGGNGGTSSFGAHCSATGGGGGGRPGDVSRGSSGGGGGVGSGGDLNLEGEHGTGAQGNVTSYFTWPPDFSRGGASRLGQGSVCGGNSGNWFGRRGNGWSPPYGYGGGGNGGYEVGSSTNYNGGAGAPGIVLIWEYE